MGLYSSKQAGLTSSKGVQTTVDVSTISASPAVVSANDDNSGFSIINTSDVDLYILIGDSASPLSLSNLTVILPAYSGTGGNLIYETPFGYSGQVQILASAGGGTGSVVVTEFKY